ncbi:type II secretion system protein GspG [Pseudoalteromonas rubra]|uniref:type II secretion system protein GspG n=1 Tax=Pseudoalteromonas rubra TaxID=43658 RepID=UPI00026CA360|nr:type II secretion system protein GspG [Pseudoalteromonas rubra]
MKLTLFILLFIFIFSIFTVKVIDDDKVDIVDIVDLDLVQISKALEIYKGLYGFYPESSIWISALTEDNDDIGGSAIIESIPKDAFGESYIYNYPSKCNGGEYDLYSKGENRIDECKSGDDLVVPN